MPLPRELATEDIIPLFSAKDYEGENTFQRRHLEKMVGREPGVRRVALAYFATWCRPCADGARKLKKAKEALKANGVLLVLVNVGEGEDDPGPVHRWLRNYSDPEFPLIMDIKSQLVAPYGLMEPDGRIIMPKTLVLDAKLKPLFLLGTEGDDFPEIIWKLNP
jgi:peroxiredoxin